MGNNETQPVNENRNIDIKVTKLNSTKDRLRLKKVGFNIFINILKFNIWSTFISRLTWESMILSVLLVLEKESFKVCAYL